MILDEGYQFGLGVFETIAVEGGKPLFLDWHLERMRASLEALGIRQTVTKQEVLEFLEGQKGEHQVLKVMASEKNRICTVRPNPYAGGMRRKGFQLKYSGVYRNETSPLVRHKTLNYGDCILEKRRASDLGADELIFLNSRGELCEGTATNLFFVRSGILYTPPVSCGLLPGIVRRFVLEHFPVREQALGVEEVFEMEECFVTNSLMGIMPVAELEGKQFHSKNVTRQCMEKYQAAVNS